MNPEQQAAVDARGDVFVSAGAGTGKTSVLVARFVEAVCDRGLDVDSILVDHVHESAPRASCARGSARRSSSAGGSTSHASSTAPGSRPSTASATGC